MSRRICLILAASFIVAGSNLRAQQSAATGNSDAGATSSPASAGDDLAKLQAENAALKKEVSDAKQTIATLQAQLAEAGKTHRDDTGAANPPAAVTADDSTPGATPGSTNAAPAGPLKALPLDATNGMANAGAPGTPDAGSRSYTVVKGDSLWKIAHKMYPHDTLNGEDKIRDANKDVFNGKFLQPGQVLVIPQ